MPGRMHDGLDDAAAEAEIGWLIDLVTVIRSVRDGMNVPPGALLQLLLDALQKRHVQRAELLGQNS